MIQNFGMLIGAVFFMGLGISSIVYTPLEFLFDLRLRMIPGLLDRNFITISIITIENYGNRRRFFIILNGLIYMSGIIVGGTPPYSFWADPPENIIAKAYVFNVTNSERFLTGEDEFVRLQEIGPIIFREKFTHSNIVFNENSTLSYTITRKLEYMPERNNIDINDTIIAPNLAMLVMASYFSDSSFFIKAGVNILLNKYDCQPFVNMSIHNFLLNATDPVLVPAKALASGLVPSLNVGVLSQMYLKNSYNITVSIGPKYRHDDYFTIQNIDGIDNVPSFKKCKPKFNQTSETTLFPQFLEKNGKVNAWKSVLCTALDAEYVNETSRFGLNAYRYEVPLRIFNRTEPTYEDCYKGVPSLPNGLADVSSCYNDYPFAASFPHFMAADPIASNRIKGLSPNIEKHGSFLEIEKISGVPLGGRAIFQINLIFRRLSGFGRKMEKFSNMNLPFAYVGYEFEGLPWHIRSFLYFMTIIVPNTQLILSFSFIVISFTLLWYFSKDFRRRALMRKSCVTLRELDKFIKVEDVK